MTLSFLPIDENWPRSCFGHEYLVRIQELTSFDTTIWISDTFLTSKQTPCRTKNVGVDEWLESGSVLCQTKKFTTGGKVFLCFSRNFSRGIRNPSCLGSVGILLEVVPWWLFPLDLSSPIESLLSRRGESLVFLDMAIRCRSTSDPSRMTWCSINHQTSDGSKYLVHIGVGSSLDCRCVSGKFRVFYL